LSELQAEYILELLLRRLTKFSKLELETEQATLISEIAELERILANEANLRAVVSAELAEVIRHIFMIPKAKLVLDPATAEQGEEEITATLSNIFSQDISNSYELYDSSADVGIAITSNRERLSNPIDTQQLTIGQNGIYAFIDNHGVRGVAQATATITFSDQDSDGVQNRDDKWNSDARYAYDDNDNGIPDILDLIYGLDDYNSSDTVNIDGKQIPISDIIRDGGVLSNGTGVIVMELNISTPRVIMQNQKEYNLSIFVNHTQQQNLDITFDLSDASIVDVTPSWNYEILPWADYNDTNLTLTLLGKDIGEGNLTITVTDEDNIEINRQVPISVVSTLVNTIPLKRDGWNLVSICRDINKEDLDLTNIDEIQSQDGKSIYTGKWADYSNLDKLEAGYGYWVKSKAGVLFDVGVAQTTLQKPLKRDGWNLMAVCEDKPKDILDMSEITEIQSQDGKSIYTGEWANYSNLDKLINGYGYWIKGDMGVSFEAKR